MAVVGAIAVGAAIAGGGAVAKNDSDKRASIKRRKSQRNAKNAANKLIEDQEAKNEEDRIKEVRISRGEDQATQLKQKKALGSRGRTSSILGGDTNRRNRKSGKPNSSILGDAAEGNSILGA